MPPVVVPTPVEHSCKPAICPGCPGPPRPNAGDHPPTCSPSSRSAPVEAACPPEARIECQSRARVADEGSDVGIYCRHTCLTLQPNYPILCPTSRSWHAGDPAPVDGRDGAQERPGMPASGSYLWLPVTRRIRTGLTDLRLKTYHVLCIDKGWEPTQQPVTIGMESGKDRRTENLSRNSFRKICLQRESHEKQRTPRKSQKRLHRTFQHYEDD